MRFPSDNPPSQSELHPLPRKIDGRARLIGWSLIGAGLSALSLVSLLIYFFQRRRSTGKFQPTTPTQPAAEPQAQPIVTPVALLADERSIPAPIDSRSIPPPAATPANIAPTAPRSSRRYLVLIIPLLCLALLAVTQYIFNLAYWFDLDLTPFEFLRPLACLWPEFCNGLRFPPYGLIALLTALLAAILFGGWLASQKRPDLLAEPRFLPVQTPDLTRRSYQIDGILLAVFGLCQVYAIVQAIQDQPVSPVVWLVGLTTLLLLGWRLDRSRAGSTPWRLLSPTLLNGLYVSGIAFLLLTAAALHAQRWTWVFVFGTTLVLLWLRVLLSNWRSWDLASRLERLALPLITLGSFLLFSFGLNSWVWSFWGDEYPFYQAGLNFANGTLTDPLLSGAGVYGYHPILSSVWQGTTMWLFGADGYGWRVSHSLLLALSIPFFYYFLRPILGRAGGLFAVALYGSAHVLLSVGHYGANNAQVIFVLASSLAAMAWAGRRGSWAGFVLAGICLGLGFYTYAVARVFSLVIAVWLVIYYTPIDFRARRLAWSNIGVWLAVVSATLLTALPVLSTRSAWVGLAQQTILTSGTTLAPSDQLLQILRNTGYGLTAFLFNDQNGLWVFGAHADPITSTLMALGLVAMLLPDRHTWRVRLSLLASYVLCVFITAGLQQYDYPSITRIFSLAPFYAIFAAIGLRAIGRSVIARHSTGWRASVILTGSALVVAALIVPLNVWQSVVLSQQHAQQYNPALLLQAAQMSADATGAGPHLYYVSDSQDEDRVKLVYLVHNTPLDRLTSVSSQDALRPNNVICQAADRPALAIITTKIPNAGYIAAQLHQCWPGSQLQLIKDMQHIATQYRIINKNAAPFVHATDGYWLAEELPQTAFTQPAETRSDWAVSRPVGLSQSSQGRLAIVEAATNQVVFLDSQGQLQNVLANVFTEASDVSFLPDDSLVVADASQGLLWFDPNGHFQFMSYGGFSPRGVFVAADGTVYVAAPGSAAIVQVDRNGEILRTIKGPQFQQPTSVAVASDGRIAVGDPVAGTVTINSSAGELLAEYPIGTGNTTSDKPGLVWLPDGGFIYTDPVYNRIVQLNPNGQTVKEWLDFKAPTDLILQSADKLLVLESRNDHIATINLAH